MGQTFRVINLRQLLKMLGIILLPLAVGGLAAFFTQNSREFYASLEKPPFSPPGAVFPVVWTDLYLMNGKEL